MLRLSQILNLELVLVQVSGSLLQLLNNFLIFLIKQLNLLFLFPAHFLHVLPVFLGPFVFVFGLVSQRFLFSALLGQFKLLGLQARPLRFQVLLIGLVGFAFVHHFHFMFLLMFIERLLVKILQIVRDLLALPHFLLYLQKINFEFFDEFVNGSRVLPFDFSNSLLILLLALQAFLFHPQIRVTFKRQFFAVKFLKFFDLFVMVTLELFGGVFVLTSLFLLLVFKGIVASFQIFNVFFFLLCNGFELAFVAFLTLEKFGVHLLRGLVQVQLQFSLLVLPVHHLLLAHKHDKGQISVHYLWGVRHDFLLFQSNLLVQVDSLLTDGEKEDRAVRTG